MALPQKDRLAHKIKMTQKKGRRSMARSDVNHAMDVLHGRSLAIFRAVRGVGPVKNIH